MAYYGTNTFDEVKKNYEDTPVLVSHHHPLQQDIRPIASRRRKWERTIKVSDTCFALSDGNYSDLFSSYNMTQDFLVAMCPIVWERREDGDYVRIRNVNKHHTINSRSKFLSWFLPKGLDINLRGGRTYIVTDHDKVEHYLPKTELAWNYQQNKQAGEDDGMFLWFKHAGGNKFERANLIEAYSTNIDIERKKRIKPYAQQFFNWVCTMRNLIRHDYDARREYHEQLEQWARDNDAINTNAYFFGFSCIKPKAIEQVIVNPDHPMRIHLALDMMNETKLLNPYTNTIEDVTTKEDLSLLKDRFNRWYTKRLNIYKVEQF